MYGLAIAGAAFPYRPAEFYNGFSKRPASGVNGVFDYFVSETPAEFNFLREI